MSNRDTHLTKQMKIHQFVTLFFQINRNQSQQEVTAISQIITAKRQVMTL